MFTSYQEKIFERQLPQQTVYELLKEMRERQVKGENNSEAISSKDSVNGVWVFLIW